MVQLLATDLDGTLLRPDKTVSDRTLAALNQARAHGLVIAFVTGRPPRWLAPVVHQTGWHGLAIAANGAVLIDLEQRLIEATRPIPADDLAEAIARIRASHPSARFAAEHARAGSAVPIVDPANTPADQSVEDLVAGPLFGYEPGYRGGVLGTSRTTREADIEELIAPGDVVKLLARIPDVESHPDEVAGELDARLRDVITVTHSTLDGVLLEMSAVGVNKATGLAQLADRHGIQPEDVVAVGDMPNDVAMLTWAGSGFAVANAHDQVLRTVGPDRVIGANTDDGVAELIERLLATSG